MGKTDKYGYHEVVDRSSVIMNNWYLYVADHEAVVENEDMKNRAEDIGNILFNFYQDFSKISFNKFPE